MKKVLFTAKVDSHIRHFHIPFLCEFKKKGYEVHVASEGDELFKCVDKKYNIIFGVNPFSKKVINSYKEIKMILLENDYDIIHTHTAIASVITRLASFFANKKKKKKARVIYTAHGFHFIKNGSLLNWILYFPIEFIFSKITDDLILINSEDYKIAERFKMGKNRYYVPGVGVDLDKFKIKNNRIHQNNCFQITYVAELNHNKNQLLLIKSIIKLYEKHNFIRLDLVGDGANFNKLKSFILENDAQKYIRLLGYREDVPEILENSDLVVSTSKREGLPINIIEAMASSLPVIATECRGHNDLVLSGYNGYLVKYRESDICSKIEEIINDKNLYNKFSKNSYIKSQEYGIKNILSIMNSIYFNDLS